LASPRPAPVPESRIDGPTLLRDAILSGRGAALVAETGDAEVAALHRAVAESGRHAHLQVIDLSGGSRPVGRRSRVGCVAPDLDALVSTPFASHVLTALSIAEAAFWDPGTPYPFAAPGYYDAEIRRALAADAGGPGAWDRIMDRAGKARATRRAGHAAHAARVARVARSAKRAALLHSEACPDLDGATPPLDADLALSHGITLVLIRREGHPTSRSWSERTHLGAVALARFLSDPGRPGGPDVVMGKWASEVEEAMEAGPLRGRRFPITLPGGGRALVRGTSGTHRPPIALPPPREPFASGRAGYASGPLVDDDLLLIHVDTDAWPRLMHWKVNRPGCPVAPSEADIAIVVRDISEGAVSIESPFPPGTGLPANDGMRLRDLADQLSASGTDRDGAEATIRKAYPHADTELVLACEDAGGGSLLHAWCRRGDPSRRRQFVLAWGRLADLGRLHGLGEGIDRGLPSIPMVAEALGLDPGRARRLVGFPVDIAADAPLAERAAFLARFARGMRPDRLPAARDAHGWASFLAAARFAKDLLALGRGDRVPDYATAFLDRCGKGGWAGRPCEPRPSPPSSSSMRDVLIGLIQIGEDLDPEAIHHHAALSVLFESDGMESLSALNDAWHADPILRLGSSMEVSADARWPAYFEGPLDVGDGLFAYALASLADLVDEGAAVPDAEGRAGLDHCVGGYARTCMALRSAIVSIRTADGERISTAEIDTWGGAHQVIQHQGRGNAAPAPDAERALGRLMGRVLDGTVKPFPSVVGFPHRAYGDEDGKACPEARDDAARRWAAILPPGWRHRDHAGLAAALDARRRALEAAGVVVERH
jgi:hypothetical protein